MRGDAERLTRQRERVTQAARRLRRAEAEALAALDALRVELAVSTDDEEGYGLPVGEVAALAGLDRERAEAMIAGHLEELRRVGARWDAEAALARWSGSEGGRP